jgi:hypothetical protein
LNEAKAARSTKVTKTVTTVMINLRRITRPAKLLRNVKTPKHTKFDNKYHCALTCFGYSIHVLSSGRT